MFGVRFPSGVVVGGAVAILAVVLLLLPGAARARAADPSRPFPSTAVAAPVLVGLSWDFILSPIQHVLGSRRRMVQVVVILGCIALYIMLRR
jgi:hypothetical protein